ncbi:MAG: uroporphyrinogen decarboxylase family protein [Planctomycetota bacterium]|jgi:uroporphyrinogen-III decarboxylase
MTSRERVLAALNHRQPDRVPIDFGSTPVSGMHVSCVADLRDYYGLEKRPVKVHEPYQILGLIEEDLMEAMGLDVQSGTDRNTIFGFINQNWKPWKTQQGLDVLVAGDFNTKVEANGDTLIYPQGDTGAPPSGRMPKGGYYFDAIVRQEPIDEAKLNPQDNLEEFKPIADESLAGIKKDVEKVVSTGRAVVANFGGTAFGDIALVPAPFLKHPKGIRDIAEWYMSTVTRQDYIHKIFSAQCEIALGNLEKAYAALGDAVDVVFICGTDFGTQTSTFCSEETYRSLYMPYYKRINQWVHENTNWKTFKHSCGSVVLFLDAFIESGFDIVNPVQCSAAGMDPGILKNKWGDRLVFWGAGVDTQKVLPFGTADQVREQVLSRCEIFSKNGGFIFNSIHNVQCRTPVENIVAMIDAVHQFSGRK